MYDIYLADDTKRLRFKLGKSGDRKLIVIGLNPSTAHQEKSDTTIAKVEKAGKQNGFVGFVMLNLYPLRETAISRLPENKNDEDYEKNLKIIEEIVKREPQPVVWAAWGEKIMARRYFVAAAQRLFVCLEKCGTSWVQFGPLTASDHPRHPSRLRYAWTFSQFDIKSYAEALVP